MTLDLKRARGAVYSPARAAPAGLGTVGLEDIWRAGPESVNL